MVGMVLLILAEVVAARRSSTAPPSISDELVGLPAGRPVVPEPGAVPEPRRLPPGRDGADAARAAARRVSALVFDLLSFGYIALTGWYFLLFVMSSYRREAMASTALGTPLVDPRDRHDRRAPSCC